MGKALVEYLFVNWPGITLFVIGLVIVFLLFKTSVNTLRTSNQDLRDDVARFKDDIKLLKEDNEKIKSDLKEEASKTISLSKTVNEYEEKLDFIQNQINSLMEKFSSMYSQTDQLSDAITSIVQKLDGISPTDRRTLELIEEKLNEQGLHLLHIEETLSSLIQDEAEIIGAKHSDTEEVY